MAIVGDKIIFCFFFFVFSGMFACVRRAAFSNHFANVRYATTSSYDVVIVGGGTGGMSLLNNWACVEPERLFVPGSRIEYITDPLDIEDQPELTKEELYAIESQKRSPKKRDPRANLPIMKPGVPSSPLTFAIIEPSKDHYYQPLWTLIGAGQAPPLIPHSKPTKDLIYYPEATLKPVAAASIEPEENMVTLENGERVQYKALVIATGLKIEWEKTKGLLEALEDPASGVCSNYSYKYCQKTAKCVEGFKGGNAIFTFPPGPVKCAGAPQKIMYLAENTWTKKKIDSKISFMSAVGKIFAVDKYRIALEKICDERSLSRSFGHTLVEVKHKEKKAVFKVDKTLCPDATEDTVTVPYDFLHATPQMGAQPFLKNSGLVNADGFVTVDAHTLTHDVYPNVFALGDATNLPTSKTMAAIGSQIPVLRYSAGKVLNTIESTILPCDGKFPNIVDIVEPLSDGSVEEITSRPIYDGYSSCPIPTGDYKAIIAEFDYDGRPLETFERDQSVPSYANGFMKYISFPVVYWNQFIKGKWEGPWKVRRFFNPNNK